jgi:hypothetical protein
MNRPRRSAVQFIEFNAQPSPPDWKKWDMWKIVRGRPQSGGIPGDAGAAAPDKRF